MIKRLSSAIILFATSANASVFYRFNYIEFPVAGNRDLTSLDLYIGRMDPDYWYQSSLTPPQNYNGMVYEVRMPNSREIASTTGINLLTEFKFPLEDGSFHTQHMIMQFPPVYLGPDESVNPNREFTVLKMGEGPLEPEIRTPTVQIKDLVLDYDFQVLDPIDDDYYQPDKNTGTTWEKFGQKFKNTYEDELSTYQDELVFGLPNRLYPKNSKVQIKAGVYFYQTYDRTQPPCSPYDDECLAANQPVGKGLDEYLEEFGIWLGSVFLFEGRGFFSQLFAFVNVFGYEQWIVDILIWSAMLWSLVPLAGFPFAALNLGLLLGYYWVVPFWLNQVDYDLSVYLAQLVLVPVIRQTSIIIWIFSVMSVPFLAYQAIFTDDSGNFSLDFSRASTLIGVVFVTVFQWVVTLFMIPSAIWLVWMVPEPGTVEEK